MEEFNGNGKRIALVRPDYPEAIMQKSFPLGLCYLAGMLRKYGYSVRIYDLNILNIKNEPMVDLLGREKVDFIGVSALTCDFPGVIDFCELVKKNRETSSIPLILGGVHPTFLPEFSLEKTQADFVCLGEAEITILDLLDTITNHKNPELVKGIAFLHEGHLNITPPRELIQDLDSIPFPAWDLIHPELYKSLPGVIYRKMPVFPILTTRGCPYQCVFCASKTFWHQRIRFRSIKNIVDEIEFSKKNMGLKKSKSGMIILP